VVAEVRNDLEQRILALAGVCQCAMLAQELARRGHAQPEPLRCALSSILSLNETEVDVALGGIEGVYAGLPDLGWQQPDPAAIERLGYTIALIALQKRLRRDDGVASDLRSLLVQLRDDPISQDPVSLDTVRAFAEIYAATVSTLSQKIMVRGDQQYLKNDNTVSTVRAVLLAGVRSAYLFHEHGGRKWHLFFGRKKLAAAANALMQTH
jgi:high frequency lysogenization protein|tara:strand:- start:6114 stop:6740 length:627 start_codon:yes stop_codon:yes gene_type:complete